VLFELIPFVYVLHDCQKKHKSPSPDDSPMSSPDESEVNPLQELTKICHEYFNSPLEIEWDASVFRVDNADDVIQGNQMLNIEFIQFWMM